jgi:hypothetical protein
MPDLSRDDTAMTKVTYLRKPAPPRIHRKKVRTCLKCREPFDSEWSGERVCKTCKTNIAWREGVGELTERWNF